LGENVLILLQQLGSDGIDAHLDQFEQSPPQGGRSGVCTSHYRLFYSFAGKSIEIASLV
jgi:hypothetical protein